MDPPPLIRLRLEALTRLYLLITFLFLLVRAQTSGDLSRPTATTKTIQFPPEFLQSFRIAKSQRDPSRFLDIYLPDDLEIRRKSDPNAPIGEFREFIARVTDITTVVESSMRDGNRTFRLSIQDPSAIRIHGLNPGHRYSISIFGRIDDQSVLIKEESVLMDPISLDLNADGAVQYFQLDPLKRFPTLDVYDIQEQRNIELYLGNLSPGRDYDISVTSISEDLQSKPWRKVVTTKPLSPTNLVVNELNSSCIVLHWNLSPESGADRFRIAYGVLKNTGNMVKTEVPFGIKHEATLCNGIQPGQTYVFAIIAEKSTQISEPATISHTVRPLSPQSFSLKADFERSKFKVVVDLPPSNASTADRCQISVVSDQAPRIEQVVRAAETTEQNQCVAFVDLVPGRRYDVSAAALSENSAQSTKILRSLALEPGFDYKAFGLNIQEVKGTLKLEWPTSETKMEKLKQLWPIIVGNGSMLHVRVDSISDRKNKDGVRQYDTWPEDPNKFVQIDHLRRGACYKIQLYTVTSSGIVSTQKFEELRRLSPPSIAVSVENITRNSATMKVSVVSFMDDFLHPVNGDISECSLNIVVIDSTGMTVLDKLLSFNELSGILMDGLRPYHTYTLKPKVVCGSNPSQSASVCPQKFRELADTVFQTNQDRPGQIQNLVVQPMNPYSAKLNWAAPALPNGIITHYVVKILALNGNAEAWSINFTSPNLSQGNHSAVVDGLIGGLNYNFNVQAVTEAGMGNLLEPTKQVNVTMPIAAPPRPSGRVEIISESVHSSDLTVSFNSAAFSTKHGLLTKVALIVSQVGPDGRPNDLIPEENLFGNRTATWGRVQNFEFWPPYVAIELPLEQSVQLPIKNFVHTVGVNSACIETDTNQICNGPLKPGTSYRFKLRLFTGPNMSSDSLYSDIVVTEPLEHKNSLRGVFAVLFLLICCALLALFVLFVYSRRHRLGEKSGHPFAPTSNSFLPRFSRERSNNHTGQQETASKESQWAALKMIMSERVTDMSTIAADCLSKLGLDSRESSPNSNKMNAQTPNVIYNNQPPQTHLQVGTPTSSAQNDSNSVQILSAQPKEQNELNAGGTSPFNAHHRRSRSLRERTGVDQRLERLPSGPPNTKALNIPWTVIKGTNLDKSRPIRIVDFPEHLRLMMADSDYLFSIEYEEFRFVGNNQTCIAAETGPNRAKNRFTNILPYDHSRVKLIAVDDDTGSDYINASYISGFSQKREFIAAQGPLPSTRDHFWRVVWEQNCPAIVALTKCMEKGREKCHQYWPDDKNRSVLYGDIEVTLLNESEYDEYVVRQLRLSNLAEPNQPARTVLHLHYQAWPDFGAPEHPAGIVNFSRLFRSKLPPSPHNKPTIVHCSAGVGRSGTFIALDRLVQNIELGRPLDVFGIVHEMRMERCYMVQNEQQYIFIHQCLLYVLQHFYPELISSSTNSIAHYSTTSAVPPTPCLWLNHSSQAGGQKAPRIEVQHNPAFLMDNTAFVEDDEGIAEPNP
ncbi:Protein-tyrosine-phosphatase [Aphelenchoides bicaudatus]|nr:Protein-tyrosine-phosphatase [Aphelenchoides bicaudatus]